MSYQIQILSDEEFEALPYEEVSISLGLADTNTNTAYVRYVANEELQRYLINHELDHLIGEDRDEVHHDGKGVYYKGIGNVFSGIGQGLSGAAQGVGSMFSNLGSGVAHAAQNVGQGISQGVSGLAGSLGIGKNFMGGFQGGANPSGGMAAMAASNPNKFAAPANYYANAPGSSISPFSMLSSGASMGALGTRAPLRSQVPIGQGTGQPPMGYSPQSTQGMAGPTVRPSVSPMPQPSTSMTQMGSGGGQTPQPQAPQTQTQQSGGGMDIFGGLQKGLGLGQNIMSMFQGQGGMSMQGGNPSHLPDLSQLPSVQAYKNFDFRGNLAEMDPALQDAINRDFDRIDAQEEHDFRNRWKNIRSGADIENDSVFARDYKALKDSQAVRRADALAKYRMENVQTQLGVNQMEAERLQQLAQLDVDTISFNTGMDAQQAMQLKQMFGYGSSQESGIGGTLGQIGNIAGQAGNLMNSFGGG